MGRAGSGGASPTQRALGLAGYRVRATLRHRWAGYLTIVLLIGLVGGLSMGAVAGARRTQSSFSAYLASTNASDLTTGVYPRGGSFPSVTSPYYRRFARALAHLPLVTREASYSDLLVAPLKPDGAPFFPKALNDDEVETIGSANGLYFDQDRVAVIAGPSARPWPRRSDRGDGGGRPAARLARGTGDPGGRLHRRAVQLAGLRDSPGQALSCGCR